MLTRSNEGRNTLHPQSVRIAGSSSIERSVNFFAFLARQNGHGRSVD